MHAHLRILQAATATRAQQADFNTPSSIKDAYFIPAAGGSNAIAVVDPFDYPNALSDFNTFSHHFSLPREASPDVTGENSVFQVVYAGGTKPRSDGGLPESWNIEAALDTQWAHAMAPYAKIYLVEAASPSATDLLAAVQVASTLPGVKEISMSWGSEESSTDPSNNYIFTTPGIVYVAAAGDYPAVPNFPATSPNVIAVGGTTLNRNAQAVLTSETAWNQTGCGFSVFQSRPSFQNVIEKIVGNHRGTADVSFNANPSSGYLIYNSSVVNGERWFVVGGTSAGSPCVAGIINFASTVYSGFASNTQAELTRLYGGLGKSSEFRDITGGHSGPFNAITGWDFPTGCGSVLSLQGK
jgi:subtilase family serine protease